MSKTEQNSIEWLINELDLSNDGFTMRIINQAKAMHKEETCQFVSDYLDDAADYGMTAEEYYDQIYGGNNG
jgi:hypothetical protein